MKSKFYKSGALLFLLSAVITHGVAESQYNYGSGSGGKRSAVASGPLVPNDNNPNTRTFPEVWKEDRYLLNLDKHIVKDVSIRADRYKRELSQTYDMDMLMKPIEKPFHSIDKVYITSEFSTTLVFPSRYTVVGNFPSVPMKVNNRTANTVTIQAGRDFIEGNLLVTLTDKEHNKLVYILMKRFIPGMTRDNDQYEIKYAKSKQFVSSIIRYRDLPKVSEDVILETMYKLYGDRVVDVFKRDCDFETFTYDGIQYYVIRDDKFGEIEYDGINFRIANKYTGCGEQTEMIMYSDDNMPLK